MTHAAHSHTALEKRDNIDALTEMADQLRDLAKTEQARAAELAEARLLLSMALDLMKHGSWHPSKQHQVAGLRTQLKRAIR